MSNPEPTRISHHTLESLERLEKERGHINWNEVINWFRNSLSSGEEIGTQVEDVTKANSRIENRGVRLLLYYLHSFGETETVWQATYEKHFQHCGKSQPYTGKTPDLDDVIGKLAAFNGSKKDETKDALIAPIIEALRAFKAAADFYEIKLQPGNRIPLATLPTLIKNPQQLTQNAETLISELEELDKIIKAARSAIPRPVHADAVAFLCMAQERLKTIGSEDEETADSALAEDFMKFAVGVTAVGFGKETHKTPKRPAGEFIADVQHAGTAFLESLKARDTGISVLAQFKFLKGITLKSSEEDLEHQLRDVPTPMIATLIGYLRHRATNGPRVQEQDLPALGKLTEYVETILAKKMAAELAQTKPPSDAWRKVHAILSKNLYEPLSQVLHHVDLTKAQLQHLPEPKRDEGEGKLSRLTQKGVKAAVYGAIGGEVVENLTAVARLLGIRKKGGNK